MLGFPHPSLPAEYEKLKEQTEEVAPRKKTVNLFLESQVFPNLEDPGQELKAYGRPHGFLVGNASRGGKGLAWKDTC